MATRVYGSALVRPATRADVPAILDIDNDAVRHTTATYDLEPVTLAKREAWYDAKIDGSWPVLVACSTHGRVLGWST